MMRDDVAVESRPLTSKCAWVSEYATENDETAIDDPPVSMGEVPRPVLAARTRRVYERLGRSSLLGSGQLIVRVLACSLSPRDVKAMKGTAVHLRPRSLPFVPGCDVCGVVVDADDSVKDFQIGDTIVGNTGRIPQNGLSEHAVVPANRATRKPPSVDVLTAAASPTAAAGVQAASFVEPGDRVLILGGSGGVGAAAIQLAKARGAVLVATTTSDPESATRRGADLVVDRRWWDVEDFLRDPLDVIVDAVGEDFAKAGHALKSGYRRGRYVAVAPEEDHADQSSWFKAVRSAAALQTRAPRTALNPHLPSYRKVQCTRGADELREVLHLVATGQLSVPLHPSSPFPFTEYGVKDAFRVASGRRARGKVVVRVADK